MTKEITFMCCFCGDTCSADLQVALIENPGDEEETDQVWFTHFGCFEQALHEKARVFQAEFPDGETR